MSDLLDKIRKLHQQFVAKERDYETTFKELKAVIQIDKMPMPTSLIATNDVRRLMTISPGVLWEKQASAFIQQLHAEQVRRGINL